MQGVQKIHHQHHQAIKSQVALVPTFIPNLPYVTFAGGTPNHYVHIQLYN